MTNYTQKGWTPLYYAVESNAEECLKLLLSHGAKVNITTNVSNYEKSLWANSNR